LAEILPHESADAIYYYHPKLECSGCWYEFSYGTNKINLPYDIPCWSLAALLDYLKSKNKFPEIKELSDRRFKLTTYIWDGEDCIQVSIGDTIVDACYELILKLHELNLL
jgi:uncharacterized membrane protein